MVNFIIDSKEKIKEKIEMINSLSDMKITLNILETADSEDEEFENSEEKQLYDLLTKDSLVLKKQDLIICRSFALRKIYKCLIHKF